MIQTPQLTEVQKTGGMLTGSDILYDDNIQYDADVFYDGQVLSGGGPGQPAIQVKVIVPELSVIG